MRIEGKKYALIDMDGVLYDSMKYHTLAWKQLMDELGINSSREEFYLYEGMTGVDTINLIFEREAGHSVSEDEARNLYARKAEIFVRDGRKECMPGAAEMISTLQSNGIGRVLVTGSAQNTLLSNLNDDYPGAFPEDMRVTALDVTHGKPDPEPYLKGLQKSGVDHNDAFVIENAPLGVRSAKAAGLDCVAVMTGPIPREEFVKEGADMIFNSMNEFAEYLKITLTSGSYIGQFTDTIKEIEFDKSFILTDSNVIKVASNLIHGLEYNLDAETLVIKAGEDSKSLDSISEIWRILSEKGATRKSILIAIGGGMITDLGGFAAACFKRGIRTVNIATTLLAAVDAAIGGKTGIDFLGLKNEIGAFHLPVLSLADIRSFGFLPATELLSGWGEVLKTGLLDSEKRYNKMLGMDPLDISEEEMMDIVNYCRGVKSHIVELDPTEKGLRKVLNLGHTAGHALESLMMERNTPVAHGIAIAHGLLVTLILSHLVKGLDSGAVSDFAAYLKEYFPQIPISCRDYDRLWGIACHDKKNDSAGYLNFVLLSEPGSPIPDCLIDRATFDKALEIYTSF